MALFALVRVRHGLIKRCDKEQKQDGEEFRNKDHDGYPSRYPPVCVRVLHAPPPIYIGALTHPEITPQRPIAWLGM
jgi:hypothetical protein